jgi:chemotaxis protein CheX
MDTKYIEPIVNSLQNVFATMLLVNATPGEPVRKSDKAAMGDYTGVIDMVGPQAKGSVAITFPEHVILDINQKMFGDEKPSEDALSDFVGEITNMIIGGAKKLFLEEGIEFDMAVPSIIRGHAHIIKHHSDGEKVAVPVSTDVGMFYLELCFKEQ